MQSFLLPLQVFCPSQREPHRAGEEVSAHGHSVLRVLLVTAADSTVGSQLIATESTENMQTPSHTQSWNPTQWRFKSSRAPQRGPGRGAEPFQQRLWVFKLLTQTLPVWCQFSHLQARWDWARPVELNQSMRRRLWSSSAGLLVALCEVHLVLWQTSSSEGVCRIISQHKMWLMTMPGEPWKKMMLPKLFDTHRVDLFLSIIWCSLMFSSKVSKETDYRC